MSRFSAICLLVIALVSCKTTHYAPKTYPSVQIIAGSSGGVTGMMREYVLFDNGQVFVSNGIAGDYKEKSKLRKREAGRIFDKAGELKLRELKFNHPGNMTYYITIKDPKRSNTIKWGESGTGAPDGVKEFYDHLMSQFNP